MTNENNDEIEDGEGFCHCGCRIRYLRSGGIGCPMCDCDGTSMYE